MDLIKAGCTVKELYLVFGDNKKTPQIIEDAESCIELKSIGIEPTNYSKLAQLLAGNSIQNSIESYKPIAQHS